MSTAYYDKNTLSLFHFDQDPVYPSSGGMLDDCGKNWHVYGNKPVIQKDTAKFYGAAKLVTSSFVCPFTISGDFTIEFWAKLISYSSNSIFCKMYYNSNGIALCLFYNNYNTITVLPGPNYYSTGVDGDKQWNHYCITRAGTGTGNTVCYVNGKKVMAITTSGEASLSFGGNNVYAGGGYFNGYLDEVRVSNIARYTGEFTPQTMPFFCDEVAYIKHPELTMHGYK